MGDFRNIIGYHVSRVVPNLKKSIHVLYKAVRGDEVASDRLPVRLQVEITDKCNFGCIMCDRETLKRMRYKLSNDLPYEVFQKLVDEIKPVYVTLNGLGEPLSYKDLSGSLKLCRERRITVSMPTNMSLMSAEKLDELLQHPPDILTFSIHGTTEQSFQAITQTSDFNRTVASFERLLLKRHGNSPKIRLLYALQAKNLNNYEETFSFLEKWNMLESFSLVPVFDMEASRQEKDRVVPTASEKNLTLEELDKAIDRCSRPDKKRFLRRWKEVLLEIKGAEDTRNTDSCLIPWISTYITAKGNVLPCCYLTGEDHIMGNVNTTSFAEIWKGKEYREFRRMVRDDRKSLAGCYKCPRSDDARLRRYRFLAGKKSKWPIYRSRPSLPGPAGSWG